jgi:hypothetical protein
MVSICFSVGGAQLPVKSRVDIHSTGCAQGALHPPKRMADKNSNWLTLIKKLDK